MLPLNIRWKLTLWYGAVLTAVLIVFGGAVYFVMRHQLLQRIDQGLHEELSDVLYEVQRAKDPENLLDWLDRRFARHEGFDFQITTSSNKPFFVSHRFSEKGLIFPPSPLTDVPAIQSLTVGTAGRWRVISVLVRGPMEALDVRVGRSLANFEHESRELLLTFALTGPLTLLVAVGGGYFLAKRALRPVQLMTSAARQISAENLDQRVAVSNSNDELDELARTFNEMIERLECSFTDMKRFTADAAHELRTPLAVIRNEAEVALRLPRSSEEYCSALENLLEETIRLGDMADKLLFLYRQDAGLTLQSKEEVALDVLLLEVIGNMQLVAKEKGVSLTLLENDACRVAGDSQQIRRVFYNLLDNAIKYTAQGGRVELKCRCAGDVVLLTVSDTGIGIDAEHLPRVFDRFYRVDPARTAGENGAGLGLSICQSSVRALDGRIHIESKVGSGTVVTVTLPSRQEITTRPLESAASIESLID